MTPQEIRQVLQDHEQWLDSWGNSGRRAVLKHADLRGSDLFGANLRAANLFGADLSGANLEGAQFLWTLIMSPRVREEYMRLSRGSSLFNQGPSTSHASLEQGLHSAQRNRELAEYFEKKSTRIANLRKVNFSNANLKNADFTEADVRGSNFSKANLENANFRAAIFGSTGFFSKRRTNLVDADLTTAGLSQSQIDQAIVDHTTLLPTHSTSRRR